MDTYFLTREPETLNGEKEASSINGAGKIGKPHAKTKKKNERKKKKKLD